MIYKNYLIINKEKKMYKNKILTIHVILQIFQINKYINSVENSKKIIYHKISFNNLIKLNKIK